MTDASRPLATAPWGARFASGLLKPSYTTYRDTTETSGLDPAMTLLLPPQVPLPARPTASAVRAKLR